MQSGEKAATLWAPFAEAPEVLLVLQGVSPPPEVPRDHLQPPDVLAELQTAAFAGLVQQLGSAARQRHPGRCSRTLWTRKGTLNAVRHDIPPWWASHTGFLALVFSYAGCALRRARSRRYICALLGTCSLSVHVQKYAPPHGELPSSPRSIACACACARVRVVREEGCCG